MTTKKIFPRCIPHRLATLAATAAVAVALTGSPPASAAAKASVVIDKARIELGDLSPTVPRPLLHLDIAPAPGPGLTTTISRDTVRVALRRAGADEALADGMPSVQRVMRGATLWSPEDLEPLVRGALTPNLPLGISVASINGLTALTLPTGELAVEARPGKLRRSTQVTVSFVVDGRVVARETAVAMLEGDPRTPTVRNDLPRGSTVTQADVTYAPIELDRLPSGAATRDVELVGMTTTQPLRAGAAVQRTALKVPPDIERGASIQLVAVRHGLRISRMAEAQEEGKVGDLIRVKPSDDGAILRAKIHSSTEVRIELGGEG